MPMYIKLITNNYGKDLIAEEYVSFTSSFSIQVAMHEIMRGVSTTRSCSPRLTEICDPVPEFNEPPQKLLELEKLGVLKIIYPGDKENPDLPYLTCSIEDYNDYMFDIIEALKFSA